jgi:hypothetical protein
VAYNTEVLKKKAIKVITESNLIFIDDICAMIGISVPCFYDHFKVDSNDFNELRSLLDENKISLKVSMRKKWADSDNATMQMALYKLCSTPEEHKKLQQNYIEATGSDGTPLMNTIVFKKYDNSQEE